MNPIIQLIISQIPTIAAIIREARAKDDPNAPPVTSQEIIDAFEQLFKDDVMKDVAMRAALEAEIRGSN